MEGVVTVAAKVEKLDTDEELAKLIRYEESYVDALTSAFEEMNRDRQYFDGQQWTAEEKAELDKRGQPDTVINLIAKKLNYVLGAEVEERADPVAYPRTPVHDDETTAISDAIRYAADAGKFDAVKSLVAEDLFIAGIGGAICEVERVRDEVKIAYRQVRWDRCFYDPHSRHPLFEDTKFRGAIVWLDREDALSEYPKAKAVVEAAVNDPGASNEIHDDKPSHVWFDKKRDRIKVCEIYYRHKGTWYVAHFTKAGFLIPPMPSPYKDEYGTPVCPLELVSAYVRDKDGARYGLVRNMVSPQDEVNKRRSKALHLLSVRQVIAEDGAVQSVESTREELAKPDGYVVVSPGYMQNGAFQIAPTGDLAQGQATLLQESKAELMQVGADAAAGDVSSSASGRARLAAQQVANRELKRPFDNLREWALKMYTQTYWRIRQFWVAEMWLRVRDNDDTKGYRFVGLNRKTTKAKRVAELLEKGVDPEAALKSVKVDAAVVMQAAMQQVQALAEQAQQMGQQVAPEELQKVAVEIGLQHPLLQEPFTAADVAHLDVDIIIETAPNTAVVEQEEFEALSSIGPALVQAGFPPAEYVKLLVKASQLRSKREILAALEQPKENPEQDAIRQKQLALTIAQMEADVGKTQAQTMQAQATAAKMGAEAQTAPARAMGEQAYAAKTMAEAGRATVPDATVAPQPEPMA